MAVKPCRECKKEMPTYVKTCPNCGAAYPTDTPGLSPVAWAMVLITLGGIVGFMVFPFL